MQRFEVLTSWAERTFPAMGSEARVLVHGGPSDSVDWARQELERLESLWSRFRAGTDVTRLNAAAGHPVHVAPETIALVELAVALWTETSGRFDPTVLSALEALGYDESFERVRARSEAPGRQAASRPPGLPALDVTLESRIERQPAPGCAGIAVDSTRGTIMLPPQVALDLGGIGKGAAADHVARCVLERGALGASIAIGGDVRCIGTGPHDGRWQIDVEDPFDEKRVLFSPLVDGGALVTSTVQFRRWRHQGIWRHHIIDPATGLSSASGLSAVIVADATASRAEALAKAALVAGRVQGAELLVRSGVTGWLIDGAGQAVAIEHARFDEVGA